MGIHEWKKIVAEAFGEDVHYTDVDVLAEKEQLVRVSHRGETVTGKVLRYDDRDPHSSPFYVIALEEGTEIKVPAHRIQKLDEADNPDLPDWMREIADMAKQISSQPKMNPPHLYRTISKDEQFSKLKTDLQSLGGPDEYWYMSDDPHVHSAGGRRETILQILKNAGVTARWNSETKTWEFEDEQPGTNS